MHEEPYAEMMVSKSNAPLSIASGHSVEVRILTTGNPKNAPSSGIVSLSLTTQKVFFWSLL